MDKNIQTIFIFTSGFFVGYFLKEADVHWKKTKNEEKALEYSQAAANYSTVYQTFCK